VEITVELPNDIAERQDPQREALEALVIAGYRSGELSARQASRLLGFSYRFELDAFLKARNIFDHAYDVRDLENDLETLRALEDMKEAEDEHKT
jgi:predicted HTH domain antitoxin